MSPGQSDLLQLNGPIVEVRPVRIPDYLDTKDVVTLNASGQIVASRNARWGERAGKRTARRDLSLLECVLPAWHVSLPRKQRWDDSQPFDGARLP
jgi:uncharacterized lipoprotein YmbA